MGAKANVRRRMPGGRPSGYYYRQGAGFVNTSIARAGCGRGEGAVEER